MRSFEITVSTLGSIDSILATLGATENQICTATMRALNKTALWLKSQSVQTICKQKQLQQKLIRERLTIIKANRSNLKAFVTARLRGIRACDLGAIRQTPTGVTVGGRQFDHAFIARMPSGHTGVFQRKGVDRLPIEEVTIPLDPEATQTIEALVNQEASDRFTQLFRHELSFILRGR